MEFQTQRKRAKKDINKRAARAIICYYIKQIKLNKEKSIAPGHGNSASFYSNNFFEYISETVKDLTFLY